MKKYLYFNYFRDSDPARRAEYLYCVKNNLDQKFIDRYFVFLDDQDHASDIPEDGRIEFVTLGRRAEFQDAIDHAGRHLPDNSVFIIVNLDIYLARPETWSNIDRDFFDVGYPNKAMVCTRHNLESPPGGSNTNATVEGINWYKGDFCDAYVFKTPLTPEFANEDFRFCIGHTPQCDNLMMGLMSKHYHTYSWGAKYMIVHYDICRNAQGDQKLQINTATVDQRARLRDTEHRNIPTQQAWSDLLKSGQAPVVTYTWFDYKRTK